MSFNEEGYSEHSHENPMMEEDTSKYDLLNDDDYEKKLDINRMEMEQKIDEKEN